MRVAVRKNPGKAPVSRTESIPAPVKGWFAQQSFVDQDEKSAIILENWFPEADSVRARRGNVSFSTGMTGEVQSLLVYTSATASKMFGANGGNIYDVTAGGAVGAAAVSGLTNNKWQSTMMATAGGQFLCAVNGQDSYRAFDGSSWSTPSITGATSSTFINIALHKKRLWFVQAASMSLWYLPVDSISGTVSEFPVGAQFTKGGYIVSASTWSVNAGSGPDDLFVIQTSEGEVAIYQGTDPGSPTTWALVYVFTIGRPLGSRCFFKVGGDLAILCEDGLLPLSKAVRLDRAALQTAALTANIRQAYAEASQRAGSAFGWQMISHPVKNMGIVNVPGSGSIDTCQFVVNTLTGAWCKFTGWAAMCWAFFDGEIYFGCDDGTVRLAEYGGNDNGEAIELRGLQAYNHLKARGLNKHVKMAKPIFATDTGLLPSVGIAVNYEDPQAAGASQDILADFFTWDVSKWDEDPWYGETVSSNWRGGGNIGTVIAPFWTLDLDSTTAGADFKLNWIGTEIAFEVGGPT